MTTCTSVCGDKLQIQTKIGYESLISNGQVKDKGQSEDDFQKAIRRLQKRGEVIDS